MCAVGVCEMFVHSQHKTSHSSPCKFFLVLGSFVVPFVLPLTRKGRKSDYGYFEFEFEFEFIILKDSPTGKNPDRGGLHREVVRK